MGILTIFLAIFVFGFLIFIHEFGHYIFARIFKVTITEFSIGMGPKLLWYDSKKTGIRYCLSAIPFGGYVAMVGEDGENEENAEDPNAFNKKPGWQRLIILAAGATINIIAGVLAIVILVSSSQLGGTTIHDFYRNVYEVSSSDTGLMVGDDIVAVGNVKIETSNDLSSAIATYGVNPVSVTVVRDGKQLTVENVCFPIMENKDGVKNGMVDFQVDKSGKRITVFYKDIYEVSSYDGGLRAGDRIIKVDGKRVRIYEELSYEIMRKGNEPVDITVIRNGEEKTLENVVFPTDVQQGQVFGIMDFVIYEKEKTFGSVIGYSLSKSVLIVRMCYESIADLIVGRYTVAAVSGPVGISEVIGEAATMGAGPLLNIVALISINLGIMNLLPIPALDGGRFVVILIEMITKKKLPPKVEQTMNAVGLIILLGLSAVIMVKDVIGLFK